MMEKYDQNICVHILYKILKEYVFLKEMKVTEHSSHSLLGSEG